MPMLILETFVLMFVSAGLGWALGGLMFEAYGPAMARLTGDDPATPWLGEAKPHVAAPQLPSMPQLLSDAERSMLTASLAALPTPAMPTPAAPAPAVETVSSPAAAPAAVAPAPVAEPAAVAAVAEPAADTAEPVIAAPPVAAMDFERAAEADRHGDRPLGLAAPRAGGADDLKRIKGIGKQNEARLNGLGIWHFDQIAAWTPDNIRWAGSFLAFVGRIEREDWVGQAKVLAAGGTTEFAARVDAGEVPSSSS